MSTWLPRPGDLSLLDPWYLLLALALPWVAYRARRGARAALLCATPRLYGEMRAGAPYKLSWRQRLLRLPRALDGCALLAAVLALARPVERVALPLERSGIEVLLCMDLSSSMATREEAGGSSRLQTAKQAAIQFLQSRPADRIGLVGFARYPDVLAPPTLDHRALEQMLLALEPVPADGAEDATGIGTAVARSAAALSASDLHSKVLILLTDGEENVATAQSTHEIGPARAARIATALGLKVYSIAVGSGRRAPDGSWIALDTAQVRELAEASGGAFFAARDPEALATIFGAIDALERTPYEEARFRLEERYLPCLLCACLLWCLSRWLDAGPLQVMQ